MKLHLLRHAKTNQESKSGKDFDRELLVKGEKQALEMNSYLKFLKNVDVHCSAATRTRQTFVKISQKIGDDSFDFNSIHFSNELYLCSHINLLNYVNEIQSKNDLLIIGHNNGISDFASYLSNEYIELKTCGYCCLEINVENWKELSGGTAKIITKFRPEVD